MHVDLNLEPDFIWPFENTEKFGYIRWMSFLQHICLLTAGSKAIAMVAIGIMGNPTFSWAFLNKKGNFTSEFNHVKGI